MRRSLAALAVVVLWAASSWAAPPKLSIPAEVRPAGQYCRFLPETDAKSVLYVSLSGVEPIPSDVLKDGRLFLLDTRGLAAGRYKFAAVAASADGEQARQDFAVVIGDKPPPDPIDPVDPADPLVQKLQAAYAGETDPAKATLLAGLAAFYRQAALSTPHASAPTWGGLFDMLAEAARTLGISGKLVAVQKVVAGELAAALPSKRDEPLTAEGKAKAAELFAKLGKALSGVKP